MDLTPMHRRPIARDVHHQVKTPRMPLSSMKTVA